MSLLPYLVNDSSELERPSRILDQHFGIVLQPEDIHQPLTVPSILLRSSAGYVRTWKSSAAEEDIGSIVSFDKDNFQVFLDVQQFKFEEVTVRVAANYNVIVEGKHELKPDENGKIYRHFIRRYFVPKNCDMDKIESKLLSDGILTITAPRIGENQLEHKMIPIIRTEEPGKPMVEKICEMKPEKKCVGGESSSKNEKP